MLSVTGEAELRGAVEAWIADDPDELDRAELQELLDRALPAGSAPGDRNTDPHGNADAPGGTDARGNARGNGSARRGGDARGGDGDAGAVAELRDRFADRLHFGTAGLRGAVAAGPNRMNRAVVRAATAAVAGWLLAPDSARDGGGAVAVVVGCDARHRSAEFADEVAGVLAGAGIAVHMLPRPCPTPLLAFAVRYLGTAAGVMITASHNPAADNGYKLYLGDGAQVIPPADAQVEERIAALGPLARIPVGAGREPAGHPARRRDRPGVPGRDGGRGRAGDGGSGQAGCGRGRGGRRASRDGLGRDGGRRDGGRRDGGRRDGGRRDGGGAERGLYGYAWGGGAVDAAGDAAGGVRGAARGGRAG